VIFFRQNKSILLIDNPLDDGLVACPICWARMKPWQVDRHIDRSCPGSPQPQKPQSTSAPNKGSFFFNAPASPTPTKPPERLPALAYSMLKDSALRKKLQELGLSTAGTRQMLENRHREWVTLWNANCDSARPKKRSELLQDLEAWERTQGSRAPTNTRSAAIGAQIKDKDFDGAAWAAKHQSSFKDLIAKARSSRQKTSQPKEAAASGSGEASSSGGSAGPSGGVDTESAPKAPSQSVDVVDLTVPPSSQPEPPGSPLGFGVGGEEASRV
jgi:E3 ubiquitin-protein ligase RAD18